MVRYPRVIVVVAHPDQLPPRQRQDLALLATGMSDKAIAAALGLGVQTVKNYCTLLYRRLPLGPVSSPRTAAVAWYLRLIPPAPDPPPERSGHGNRD